MCGICGIYGKKDEISIKKMIATLKHRGPDSDGFYLDENISFGHARLSIIDLSERGRQPMANEDKTVWLSINGEIYNFQELREELLKKGHLFYSQSDSEIVIHSYEEYGLDFIEKLRGMFALALYDSRKNRLILARDPIGEKPLYYYYDGKLLIFASEIKVILATGVKKTVDESTLYGYLAYQYSFGENTFFKDIKKLLAGNIIILEKGNLTIKKYWDINPVRNFQFLNGVKENIIQADEEYFIKKLRELLEESVELRMVADVPIGYFLSGGIDSSAIVALARKYSNDEFHTFSVGFETFSELKYAKIVSQHLKTTHHELMVTADMVAKDLSEIARYYDEPLGDAAIINNYYLAKEARKYVKVLLAGEGGDELFAGYSNYKTNLRFLNFFKIPVLLKNLSRFVLNFIPRKGDFYSKGNEIYRLLDFFLQPTLEKAHLFTTRDMTDAEIQNYTHLRHLNMENLAISYPKIKDPLNQMLAIDCKNLLPEKFLMKADKATMANSLEERLPILDKKIIEFAFSIPLNLKIKNGQEKYILRKAVADLLPQEIVNRPKQGFGTPVDQWLKSESIKKMVLQKLSEGKLIKEIFKKEKVKEIIDNLEKDNINRARTIWIIFALQLWHEIYFEACE